MRFRFLGIGNLFQCPKCIDTTKLKSKWRLFHYTFCYNELNNTDSITDLALNPIFWFVDNFAYYFGIIFVALVWALLINMVLVFYIVLTPYLYANTPIQIFLLHFTIGNWLTVNTYFHYFMGWRTKPGEPPSTTFDNFVSICKKCMQGKPPRTHHCSICKKCVLKMDHHCPWFNNCIGHYNHRYFFLFCLIMTIDCVYLSTIGFHYFQKCAYPGLNIEVYELFAHQIIPPTEPGSLADSFFYKAATVEFFVAFVAFFALFLLTSFNAFLISYGSTNIEIRSFDVNCCSLNSCDNQYNLGFVNNWKVFLGFDDYKSFILKVLLPSAHKPLGDGVNWKEYIDIREKWLKRDIYEV